MTANVLYRIEQPGSNNDNKYIFEGSVETGDGQDLKKVYLTASIQGGVYEDNVVLQDATLPDNADVMRNLANSTIHQTMVRSQYELKP